MKRKVVCPNDKAHKGYEKVLFAFEERPGKAPNKFYIYCGRDCRTWHKVTFNANGGCSLKKLPKKYHLDLFKTAVVIYE